MQKAREMKAVALGHYTVDPKSYLLESYIISRREKLTLNMKWAAIVLVMVAMILPVFGQQTAEAWNNKGAALDDQGKYDDAIKAFDEAIRINPNYADAWYNKGVAFYHQKKYNEAIQAYDKAIKIDPQFADAWQNKGNALEAQGKDKEAAEALYKAVEILFKKRFGKNLSA